MKHKFKEGQLVRVGRCDWHGVPFGAVCTVVEVCGDGDLAVVYPGKLISGFHGPYQYVDGSKCKPAKQAAKKGRK